MLVQTKFVLDFLISKINVFSWSFTFIQKSLNSSYFILVSKFADHENQSFPTNPVQLSISLTVSLDPREEFSKFKVLHAKVYANNAEEELRFTHFSENLKKIEKHNPEGHTWRMGITKFADLSEYIIYDIKY